ncbi:LuxR C-terminal-related transcriptional regulator [Kribbella kalugense]|uniref:LuxR family maltose regulon positive regulatory protein n=1 Tax=Kribbella kalugense TaxID=2512221 RepID=A0A4R7ZVF6_9ACTN|nr:LuxR C-terminal-related transcriptional regulator [Kribbella kalugense]TDW21912.1 LuxR family maltose regulon positive regulatory protein [Kribbella kalugense]
MPGPDAATPTGLIDRHDLVAALDRAATLRVTVVSAPAGSGKTSLLRAWAARRARTAFVSVRPDQQDAQLFWLALLGALRAATGGSEPPPPSPGFNGPAMVDKVRAELVEAGDPFILVIDDLHELSTTEAAEQLATLLTSLPSNVHAIVATRGESPVRLHRLRLAGQLAEIRAGQFRFSLAETRALVAAAGITLTDADVAVLHERTEGWAAGLRLAVLALAGHPDPSRFVAEFSGNDRTIAEYLMAEMLERQPADVQRLLLRTSVLDQVNGELADLLTGGTGSERILLELEDANAFVVSLDPGRTWFRYHHLFRDLLRLELRRTTPGDIPELHRLAAGWFAVRAEPTEFIRHLQAAGDWALAARVLTDHALSLTLDGKAGTVAALLRSFPPRFEEDSPGLALVHAIADLDELRLDQAAGHLNVVRAYAATTPRDRQYRLRTAIASLELLSARLRGNFDGVFEQVDALPTPDPRWTASEVALSNDLRAIALLNLGVSDAWSLRLAESEKYLSEGADLARDIGRPYLEVACMAHLGFAAVGTSIARARQYCEDAVAEAARHGWDNEPVIAPAYATLAGILSWTGDYDQAELWLQRAQRATQGGTEPGLRLVIHLAAAILQAARGRDHEALAEFDAAQRVEMAGRHALLSRIVGWSIATQVRLGSIDQARDAVVAVDEELAATGELRNAIAVLRLAEADPAGARDAVRAVLDGSAPINPVITLIEACLLDALACRSLGDLRAARAGVERALNLAEPDRVILPFAMTGAWQLLEDLPPHGTSHAALIADILDAARTEPDRATSTGDLSPSELRVLRYLPTNLTRPEIAAALSVSLNTVNTHLRHIYAKLNATDRSTAVQRARDLRLLSAGRS